MKLIEIYESSVKDDEVRKKRSAKATDLGKFAQAVWNAKDIEAKRKAALTFVSHMTAGKQEQHRKNVEAAATAARLDSLVSNIMLSGEGKAVMK